MSTNESLGTGQYAPPNHPRMAPPSLPSIAPVFAIIAVAAIIGLWTGTEYVALQWGYAHELGKPWLVTHRPHLMIYPPQQLLRWTVQYHTIPRAKHTLRMALTIAASVWGLLTVGCVALRRQRRWPFPSVSHGSAQWGFGETLRHRRGLLLGRLNQHVLRYGSDGHLVTVAPTRTGKGVGVIIPNLLTYEGTMIVTDPKGENCAVTARRRRALGHTVAALDPFKVLDGLGRTAADTSAAYNPIDLIDPTAPDAVDDARMLADMLIVADDARQSSGEHAFWNEEARGILSGLILHVAANRPPALRHLPHVRELLTLPPDEFAVLLEEMSQSDAAGGLVARAAARVLQKAEKERSGVISSAQSHTHFLDSPRMADVLTRSTIDLQTLVTTPTTLYLIVPPDRMTTYRRWLRLMLACTLLTVTRGASGASRTPHRIVFLIDEFAQLGRMEPIEQQIALVAGYGATFWLFVQDFAQLKALYGERWQSLVANADVLQAFGTADQDTAEYLSKLTGDATIHVESDNQSRSISHGKSGGRQISAAHTISEKTRRLLLPDEVRRLGHKQLLFVRGQSPVLADRISYVADVRLATLADHNPYVRPSPGNALP